MSLKRFNVFDVRDAVELYSNENYKEALDLFLKIHEYSLTTMQNSNFVIWHIACCYDMLLNPLEAAHWINLACDNDPLNSYFEGSRCVIYNKISDLLESKMLEGDVSMAEKIYTFIYKSGRVTSASQFTMIRFHMRQKNFTTAKEMLDNALGRNPYDRDFINLRKEIAEIEGDQKILEQLSLVDQVVGGLKDQ